MSDQQKDTVSQTSDQMKIEDERAKLDKYKQDLLKVHGQLKAKSELFNALQERGIQSADQLQEALEKPKDEDKKLDFPSSPEPNKSSSSDVEELKALVLKQQDQIQQQQARMDTDRLMGEIRTEIKDKPEYALLDKGLNESIAYNILRARAQDKEKGLTNKPLTDYLKSTESELRAFFGKLGGKIEGGQEQGKSAGAREETAPSRQSTPSENSLIDFPTLPESGDSTDKKPNLVAEIEQMGTDKRTKRFDDRQAFEGFLQKNIDAGEI